MKFYKYTFQDGYFCYASGFSKQELKTEENKHGKLIKKELA